MHWEYRILTMDDSDICQEENPLTWPLDCHPLATLGEAGWELVSVVSNNHVSKLFFKRPQNCASQ
jgi:hypothetical protein